MVNEFFIRKLDKFINKMLKKEINGKAHIWTTPADPLEQLDLSLFGPNSQRIKDDPISYQAAEFVHARIPVNLGALTSVDMIIPVMNIGNNSFPSQASFGAVIPYSIPETFVSRPASLLKMALVPFSLVVDQELRPKDVIKQGMIDYQPVNQINGDKTVYKNLRGNIICMINSGLTKYTNTVPMTNFVLNYPMGMFSAIPFNRYTLLVSRDTGELHRTGANKPWYPLNKRIRVMADVANYIAQDSRSGEEFGHIHLDTMQYHLLRPFAQSILDQTK
jgi:hypothetical protein